MLFHAHNKFRSVFKNLTLNIFETAVALSLYCISDQLLMLKVIILKTWPYKPIVSRQNFKKESIHSSLTPQKNKYYAKQILKYCFNQIETNQFDGICHLWKFSISLH